MSESDNGSNLLARLRGALEEGVRFARGEIELRTTAVPDRPPTWQGPAVRQLREHLELSQSAFARLLNVSLKTVQGWEQGERKAAQAALRLLQILAAQPAVVGEVLGFPLRDRRRLGTTNSSAKSPATSRRGNKEVG
jgi:putative transcriptional regulator